MILEQKELDTDLISDNCEYAVLVPEEGGEGLPLLYLLHGGGVSRNFLTNLQPQLEGAIDDGVIDPLLIATSSAGMS